MSRVLFLILITIFCLGNRSKEVSFVKKVDPKNIVTLFFSTDGGRWTDSIVSSFTQQLSSTGLPLRFTNLSWQLSDDVKETVQRLKEQKPDIVFLPDDLMYKLLAKEVEVQTGALVVFVTFYSKKEALNLATNQTGVFCDAPVDKMLTQVQKFIPVQSIGVVGGPFAQAITDHITEKLPGIKVSRKLTNSWNEYTGTIQEFSKKYDAVWPLAPFGVMNADGKTPVGDHQINSLIRDLDKFSIGYGRLTAGNLGVINMNIDPKDLGKNAAALVFRNLKGETTGIEEFTSYGLIINNDQIKKLKLTVPNELLGFVSK